MDKGGNGEWKLDCYYYCYNFFWAETNKSLHNSNIIQSIKHNSTHNYVLNYVSSAKQSKPFLFTSLDDPGTSTTPNCLSCKCPI